MEFSPIIPPKHATHWVYEAFRKVSTQLGQHSFGLSAISRGETPDGSGAPLVDLTNYFHLPGRSAGQIGYGGVGPGENLWLSSTRASDKGFIYFGYPSVRVALDEDQGFTGFGTSTPSATVHIHIASPGTTTIGAIGNLFLKASTVEGVTPTDIMTWTTYQNNNSSYDVAILSGGLSGTKGIYFTDYNLSVGLRYAFGFYGQDTITYHHMQFGGLNSDGTTKNRNALFVGFNDNCMSQASFHAQKFDIWAEGDNLPASPGVLTGRTTTNAGLTLVGINSPTAQRTGTTEFDDQPVMTIGGGHWYQQYSTLTLRLTTGSTFAGSGGTEGTDAKRETFQIREGGSLNSGTNRLFAIDWFGRLCLYNPGNGALTSRISGRRSDFLLEDGITGSSTPNCRVEFASTNAFADAGLAYQMRLGYDDVEGAARNVLIGSSLRTGGNVQPGLLARYAIRTSAFYISDGTFTFPGGEVGAPLGLVNIYNFGSASTIMVALKRRTSQTADMMRFYQEDGSTVLSGFTSAGAYYLVAGAASGRVLTSDTNGVGSWGTGASLATRVQHRWTANGPYAVDTSVDGGYIPPTALTISAIWIHRTTAGTSGDTRVQVRRNGTALFTAGARPVINFADGDNKAGPFVPDVSAAVSAGDILTIDIDEIEGGEPQHLSVTLEGA